MTELSAHLRHVAIIPDGNRRWAEQRGLPHEQGHTRAMFEVIPAVLEGAWQAGLHTLTLWLFSTENWRRDAGEVSALMRIYERGLETLGPLAARAGARVVHLGRKERLPASLARALAAVEEESRPRTRALLNLGLDYGGRDELVRAVNRLLSHGPGQISAADLERALDTGDQPHPNADLTLRTGGDRRLSGLMPWQLAHSELCFTERLFPDLRLGDLEAAAREYAARRATGGA